MLILVDDMRRDFQATLRTLFDGSWVEVTNATAACPLCGPSRAALLTGKYASRTGVLANGDTNLLDDNDTIATRMKAAGYRTGLFGKYLNYYPWGPNEFVPPGWDEWKGHSANDRQPYRTFTDETFAQATDFVSRAPTNKPFFLYVATRAPHPPAIPPQRYANTAVNPPQPGPGLNEPDVSDKASYVGTTPPLSASQLAEFTELRADIVRCLMGIDDGIRNLVQTLAHDRPARADGAHLHVRQRLPVR